MKNIVLFICLSCYMTNAQVNLAFSVGANYSNFSCILFGKDYYNYYQPYNKFILLPNTGVEISYSKNYWRLKSGIFLSYRGFIDTYDIIYPSNTLYYELPVEFSYSYFKNKLESGVGLIFHKRGYAGDHYYHERNKPYGVGIRLTSMFHVTKRIGIKPSYTFGNVDKYILNTYSNFLHHVFAMNVVCNFYRFGKKKK